MDHKFRNGHRILPPTGKPVVLLTQVSQQQSMAATIEVLNKTTRKILLNSNNVLYWCELAEIPEELKKSAKQKWRFVREDK